MLTGGRAPVAPRPQALCAYLSSERERLEWQGSEAEQLRQELGQALHRLAEADQARAVMEAALEGARQRMATMTPAHASTAAQVGGSLVVGGRSRQRAAAPAAVKQMPEAGRGMIKKELLRLSCLAKGSPRGAKPTN